MITTKHATPAAGLFKSPVGAWVRLYRFRSGTAWYMPCGKATRMSIMHGAYKK